MELTTRQLSELTDTQIQTLTRWTRQGTIRALTKTVQGRTRLFSEDEAFIAWAVATLKKRGVTYPAMRKTIVPAYRKRLAELANLADGQRLGGWGGFYQGRTEIVVWDWLALRADFEAALEKMREAEAH